MTKTLENDKLKTTCCTSPFWPPEIASKYYLIDLWRHCQTFFHRTFRQEKSFYARLTLTLTLSLVVLGFHQCSHAFPAWDGFMIASKFSLTCMKLKWNSHIMSEDATHTLMHTCTVRQGQRNNYGQMVWRTVAFLNADLVIFVRIHGSVTIFCCC